MSDKCPPHDWRLTAFGIRCAKCNEGMMSAEIERRLNEYEFLKSELKLTRKRTISLLELLDVEGLLGNGYEELQELREIAGEKR